MKKTLIRIMVFVVCHSYNSKLSLSRFLKSNHFLSTYHHYDYITLHQDSLGAAGMPVCYEAAVFILCFPLRPRHEGLFYLGPHQCQNLQNDAVSPELSRKPLLLPHPSCEAHKINKDGLRNTFSP